LGNQTDPARKGKWGQAFPGTLPPSQRAAKLHEERMKRKPKEKQKGYHQQGEPEVVAAEPLGSILRAWVVEWLKDRPRNTRGFGRGEQEFVGPINYLSEQTGINVRQVQTIVNGEMLNVPLTKADKLLIAIDHTLGMHPEILVYANPNWSPEKWLEYMAERGCV
jgi:hypothetical protein